MNKLGLVISCLSFGLILNGCTSSPTPEYEPLPQLTFAHLIQIPVQVQNIDIETEITRGAQPWDIANELPTPPDMAMMRYLERRYKAVGADGQLNIALAKANVSMKKVPNDMPIVSQLSFADQHQYQFEIVVDLRTEYFSGKPDRKTSLRFVRTVELQPHVTLNYRDTMLQRTIEQLIRDIDEGVMRTLSNEFGIIRKQDMPIQLIDVKTQKPKVETYTAMEERELN